MSLQVALTLAVVVVMATVLILMALGWRGRRKRQSGLAELPPIPDGVGDPILIAGILYVATTSAGDPLDRLTFDGLAYRGRGRVQLWPSGVGLSVDGERAVFIPAASLSAVGTSSWTIDKAVERGGLLRIDWTTATATGPKPVETYLRVLEADERERVLDALQALVSANATPNDPTTGGDV